VGGWAGFGQTDVKDEGSASGPAAAARADFVDLANAIADGDGSRACGLMTSRAAAAFADDSETCESTVDGTADDWADLTIGDARMAGAGTAEVAVTEEGENYTAVMVRQSAGGWRFDGIL
jgi:hypothetical protein